MSSRSIPKRRSAGNNPNDPNQTDVGTEIEVDEEEQEMMGNDAAVKQMQKCPHHHHLHPMMRRSVGIQSLYSGDYRSHLSMVWHGIMVRR